MYRTINIYTNTYKGSVDLFVTNMHRIHVAAPSPAKLFNLWV